MKCSELLRILKRDGWYAVRQKGSHILLKHPLKKGSIPIPFHPTKEVKKGLLLAILKKANIQP